MHKELPMNTIDFENFLGLPKSYVDKLTEYSDIFRQIEHIEEFQTEIYDLILDINEYCENSYIIGYHYTRAFPESIKNNGLLIRSGNEIRQGFLRDYGHSFTAEEIIQIKTAWKRQFSEKGCENRDNKIFFNFTLHALENGGAEYLLNHFGGEQIYFPLMEIDNISRKVSKLGMPLIVKCKLNPKDLTVYIQEPWGKIAVSAFHRRINNSAIVIDQDGYQTCPVNPENLEVINYELNNQ